MPLAFREPTSGGEDCRISRSAKEIEAEVDERARLVPGKCQEHDRGGPKNAIKGRVEIVVKGGGKRKMDSHNSSRNINVDQHPLHSGADRPRKRASVSPRPECGEGGGMRTESSHATIPYRSLYPLFPGL